MTSQMKAVAAMAAATEAGPSVVGLEAVLRVPAATAVVVTEPAVRVEVRVEAVTVAAARVEEAMVVGTVGRPVARPAAHGRHIAR